jgi:hypothetical protein
MKARLSIIFLLFLCLSAWGCGIIHDDDDDDKISASTSTGRGAAAAPCIYLYPEQAGEVSVTLLPAEDAWLTSTDPEHGEGWTVWAEPDSLIDGTYDYLYYSCDVAMKFQMDEGWAIEAEDIFSWFEETLPRCGLSQSETADFVDYWSEHLPYSPWYLVYPQYNDLIAGQIDIAIDPEPDSMLRLWLVIEKVEQPEPLTAPEFVPFERSGFTVVEWGVVFRIEAEGEEAGSVTT